VSLWDGVFIAFLCISCNNAVGNGVKNMSRCNKVINIVRAKISLQFVCICGLGLPGLTYIHSIVLFIKLGVTLASCHVHLLHMSIFVTILAKFWYISYIQIISTSTSGTR
jgi:hypothetical protein